MVCGKVFKIACAIAVIFLIGHAAAAISGAPSNITIRDEGIDFSFEVSNETNSRAGLELDFFAPTGFEIIEMPGWVDAGETAAVTIRLLPDNELTGSWYRSSLIVRLGSEEIEKNISIYFAKAIQPTGNGANDNVNGGENGGYDAAVTGFASLFGGMELPGNSFELAFDILLVLIASFLLIAFISRLVKRLNAAARTNGAVRVQEDAEPKKKAGASNARPKEIKSKAKGTGGGSK